MGILAAPPPLALYSLWFWPSPGGFTDTGHLPSLPTTGRGAHHLREPSPTAWALSWPSEWPLPTPGAPAGLCHQPAGPLNLSAKPGLSGSILVRETAQSLRQVLARPYSCSTQPTLSKLAIPASMLHVGHPALPPPGLAPSGACWACVRQAGGAQPRRVLV